MITDRKQAFDDAQKRLRWALASEAAPRINAMLDLAKSDAAIATTPDVFDREPWLLNCPNGTLDLRTGKLREHRQDDYLTQLCPTAYMPDALCPNWTRFLASVFADAGGAPDDELTGYVQRLLGRALTGDVSEQILPIFYGGGANGKSTLVNAIFETLGSDYCLKAPADLLMQNRFGKHPTEIASLRAKRFVVASETGQGGAINEQLVKDLTGGEPITARRMREDFWTFSPTHKVFLSTNHKPRIAGSDDAIWRRLRLVPFEKTFWDGDDAANASRVPDPWKMDKALGEKLAGERSGILSWLVRGCLDWREHGLGHAARVTASTNEYRSGEDVVGRWIAERCISGDSAYRARSSALYNNFREWCESSGETVISQKSFSQRLEQIGFVKQRNDGAWFLGIAPLDSENDDCERR